MFVNGDLAGFPTEKAVMPLTNVPTKGPYWKYFADPLNESDYAPSAGVICHELGHCFHIAHPEDRFIDKYKVLDSMCNRRGHVDGIDVYHASDCRLPRITAYTRKILNDIYDFHHNDTKHEWVIHDILGKDEKAPVPGWQDYDFRHFRFANPRNMQYDVDSKRLVNGKTKEPINIRVQFSDASNLTIGHSNSTVKLRVRLEDQAPHRSLVIIEEDISIFKKSDFAQYDFDKTIDSTFTMESIDPFIGSTNLELVFEIDADDSFIEYNETDNELRMPIRLTEVVRMDLGRVLDLDTLTKPWRHQLAERFSQ